AERQGGAGGQGQRLPPTVRPPQLFVDEEKVFRLSHGQPPNHSRTVCSGVRKISLSSAERRMSAVGEGSRPSLRQTAAGGRVRSAQFLGGGIASGIECPASGMMA